jgi:hypothetical protein
MVLAIVIVLFLVGAIAAGLDRWLGRPIAGLGSAVLLVAVMIGSMQGYAIDALSATLMIGATVIGLLGLSAGYVVTRLFLMRRRVTAKRAAP